MNRTTCDDLVRGLSAFVDGELEPSEAIALQRHVDGCEACAARVAFARATRTSVRRTVRSVKAPEAFRARVTTFVAQAREASEQGDVMTGSRLLSWRVAGPMAVAAAFALVWASVSKLQERAADSDTTAATSHTASASKAAMMPVENLVASLVDQHANPLPPEATSPTEIASFDRFIGVPVRDIPKQGLRQGQLLGARMVPLHEQRAAMFQYVMRSGRRVSLYVYNPKKVRLTNSRVLRQRIVNDQSAPVYVGCMRGYSVAVTDRRGVGYAMASDLDENESSKLILAVGQ